MKKYIKHPIFILLLWCLFTIGCVCAPFLVIVYPYCKKNGYVRNIVKAADRMCAALLGFTGRQMLSTELVQGSRLVWMRSLLDDIQPGHCEGSAFEEGAYCRIKDRTIGKR